MRQHLEWNYSFLLADLESVSTLFLVRFSVSISVMNKLHKQLNKLRDPHFRNHQFGSPQSHRNDEKAVKYLFKLVLKSEH